MEEQDEREKRRIGILHVFMIGLANFTYLQFQLTMYWLSDPRPYIKKEFGFLFCIFSRIYF